MVRRFVVVDHVRCTHAALLGFATPFAIALSLAACNGSVGSGSNSDAGLRPDASSNCCLMIDPRDGGWDSSFDTGSGVRDSGGPVTGRPDTGPPDAGPRDVGAADTGRPDTGPAPVVTCGNWSGHAPIRALFIGNSQVEFWALPQMVSRIASTAPAACPRIATEEFTLGGANLADLWLNPVGGRSLASVIQNGDYDVIVITESIDLAEYRPPYPEQFRSYANLIIDAARAAGSTPILFATSFPRWNGMTGMNLMATDQLQLGRERGVHVAAGGLAWTRVWNERPDMDLYWSDGAHPGYKGSYISALVIYSTITGASPMGLGYDVAVSCEDYCPPISPDEANLFQRSAWAEYQSSGR